jgi:hypothetical protein
LYLRAESIIAPLTAPNRHLHLYFLDANNVCPSFSPVPIIKKINAQDHIYRFTGDT